MLISIMTTPTTTTTPIAIITKTQGSQTSHPQQQQQPQSSPPVGDPCPSGQTESRSLDQHPWNSHNRSIPISQRCSMSIGPWVNRPTLKILLSPLLPTIPPLRIQHQDRDRRRVPRLFLQEDQPWDRGRLRASWNQNRTILVVALHVVIRILDRMCLHCRRLKKGKARTVMEETQVLITK